MGWEEEDGTSVVEKDLNSYLGLVFTLLESMSCCE
jgi:hypothetical protein